MDLPDTPVLRTPEEMLDRRLMVLKTMLDSEKIYLNELERLLTPMKALKATAGTSQPVLSSQQVQTVFYQVPELRDLHRDFYTGLRDRLGSLEPQAHPETVSQLVVYRGFIDNYESAVEIVRRCTQTDQRFRILAEDLLKHTPQQHSDHPVLQEVLRLSRSFLSGVNEGSHKQAQYRFCWYLPLAGLKLRWGPEMERTTDTHHRIHAMRAKMYLLRHELRQTMNHTLMMSSLYELEEWREAIHRLTGD
ncbi:unnamed protein product, partial [Coregonus sp. 'balchen']